MEKLLKPLEYVCVGGGGLTREGLFEVLVHRGRGHKRGGHNREVANRAFTVDYWIIQKRDGMAKRFEQPFASCNCAIPEY